MILATACGIEITVTDIESKSALGHAGLKCDDLRILACRYAAAGFNGVGGRAVVRFLIGADYVAEILCGNQNLVADGKLTCVGYKFCANSVRVCCKCCGREQGHYHNQHQKQ